MTRGQVRAFDTRDGYVTHQLRIGRVATRQRGLITRAQLHSLDVPTSTIYRWASLGYLIRVLPGVYAVGHRNVDERTRLFALVLFAGPSAVVSHGTAAYRRGWLRYPVARTHLSTPRHVRTELRGVVFHCRRELERELIDGIPCTSITRTLLDLAATEDRKLVSRSLAQLDYQGVLDAKALRTACGRGRPGSTKLLAALSAYMPQLAHTKSELEDEYLYVCQRFGIPLPEVNVDLHGEEPDCLWRDLGLVVELDGGPNHSSPAQRHRDQRKALKLRAHGLTVVRYTEDQVFKSPEATAADTLAQLEQRRRLAA